MSPHASTPIDITIATSVANSQELPMGGWCGGVIEIPSGSTITSLTFHHSMESVEELDDDGATKANYVAFHDAAGTAITMTVAADKAYTIPDAVNEAGFVKMVGNAAGSIKFMGKKL